MVLHFAAETVGFRRVNTIGSAAAAIYPSIVQLLWQVLLMLVLLLLVLLMLVLLLPISS